MKIIQDSEPQLAVLDVGHGNSAVVCDGETTVVIDAPQRSTVLLDTLEWKGIKTVSRALVTHSDADHAGGLISLLTDPGVRVERIYLNADALNETKLWRTVKAAVRDARRRGELIVHTELTSSLNGQLDTPRLTVEVLAPSPELALGGVGAASSTGRELQRNSMSAVVRVARAGAGPRSGVLLMGDLDETGFQELTDETEDLSAAVLVFPHHGGRCGSSDDETFARRISAAVNPETVVFSMSRRRQDLPLPEVVAGIRAQLPMAGMACTQLSQRCCADSPPPDSDGGHLSDWPAAGRHTGSSCAGTITFMLTADAVVRDGEQDHAQFVSALEHRVCRPAGWTASTGDESPGAAVPADR